MKIILTNHAKKRLIERKIKIEEVLETIEMPNYTITKGKLREVFRKINNQTLKVVYSVEDKYINVISIMWK